MKIILLALLLVLCGCANVPLSKANSQELCQSFCGDSTRAEASEIRGQSAWILTCVCKSKAQVEFENSVEEEVKKLKNENGKKPKSDKDA